MVCKLSVVIFVLSSTSFTPEPWLLGVGPVHVQAAHLCSIHFLSAAQKTSRIPSHSAGGMCIELTVMTLVFFNVRGTRFGDSSPLLTRSSRCVETVVKHVHFLRVASLSSRSLLAVHSSTSTSAHVTLNFSSVIGPESTYMTCG